MTVVLMSRSILLILLLQFLSCKSQDIWPELIGYPNDLHVFNIKDALANKDKDKNVILSLSKDNPGNVAIINEKDLKLLKHINKLRALFIDGEEISYLPKSFRKSKLIYASIRYTNFTHFPVKQMSNSIESLRFEHTPISNIEGISRLKNLKYLSLVGNYIDSLGEEIYQLDSLESLYLGGNSLKNTDLDISKFNNLKRLYVEYSDLEKLPKGLENLEYLGILYSKITFSSKELVGVKLKYIEFSISQLQDNLENLRKVLGSNCKIRYKNEYGEYKKAP